MGASASVGDALTPTVEEVAEAEAKALEAARVHVELARRAKKLRLAMVMHSEPERIGLRAVDSEVGRFMKADKERAMAKYAWYNEQVRSRTCPGYTLADNNAGWQIVDADEADVFLQKLDGGGATPAEKAAAPAEEEAAAPAEEEAAAPAAEASAAYTVTSVFGTRYDSLLADGKKLVFRNVEEFLARFPSPAPLDMMVEEYAEEEEEEEGEEENRPEEEEQENQSENGEYDETAADAALLLLVSNGVWKEESRRVEARKMDVEEEEE